MRRRHPRMSDTEHILLESEDRTVPSRHGARRIHAQCVFRSRLRNRTLHLEIIDYYYLCVKVQRARSQVFEYVLDLRFVDPALHFSRHIAWRSIGVALAMAALACASVSQIGSSPLRWRYHWL